MSAKGILKATVHLSLGSNLGDRAANLRLAVERVAALGNISAKSSLYETEPAEIEGLQPWFLNCVVSMVTKLSPLEFLTQTLAVEQEMGRRRRGQIKAARIIDIDIVLFGDAIIKTPGLTIPHPALHRRRFVLEPLVEISPDVRHPILQRTARELLAALPAGTTTVRKLRESLC